MLVYEFKLKGKKSQYEKLDQMIRTGQFIRNKCLAHWLNSPREVKINKSKLTMFALQLRRSFEWAGKLNSHAAQAHAERAWFAISRFYDNCKKNKPGKKGFPKFKHDSRSVEYKRSGWKYENKTITFTDGFNAGTFRLKGTRQTFVLMKELPYVKRVRVLKRAKGYFVQFCLNIPRKEPLPKTGRGNAIDLGLKEFYTDFYGEVVHNPRYLRKSELKLKRRQRRKAKRKKGSANRLKAIKRLQRAHFKVSSQRKDFAIKTAKALIQSNDLVIYEDLKVLNMLKNHKLAKSISDASWSMFTNWLKYFGKIHSKYVIAVAPHYTTQECSRCGHRVQKSLSTRTHQCPKCKLVMDRDQNAAKNIYAKGLPIFRALPSYQKKLAEWVAKNQQKK